MTATSAREGSGAMFDGIAHRYDLLNRLISLGIDQSWRRKTVEALSLGDGARVLDLATGTADLALLVARSEPSANVVGLDPSERMLEVGRKKVGARRASASASSSSSATRRSCPFPAALSTAFAWRSASATCPTAAPRSAR